MSPSTSPPAVVSNVGWRFPPVRETVLPNAIRLLAYDCPGQFVIAATLVFEVPLAVEPRALEGVAGLAGRLLTQGSGALSAERFADALALCGADLEVVASVDAFVVRLEAPVTKLREALALMAQCVSDPMVAAEEFANEQRLRLDEIEQEKAYPNALASKALNRALYPESSRRSRPAGGTAETVGAIRRDDVVDYVRDRLYPSGTTLIMTGDFRNTDPRALAAEAFGSWAGGGEASSGLGDFPVVSWAPRIVLVDQPAAPQSTLRVAGPAITRADPRWAALFVANYCVGGSFGSRINTVLREQKGFTYGADSSVQTTRDVGVFVVATSVRSDATTEALSDIVTITRDVRGGFSDEEVGRAVTAASESMALGFERASAVAARVELLVSSGLPLDHIDTNLAALRAVTPAAAAEAYRDVIDPATFTIVVVGDRATHADALASLGHGPLADG